MLGLVVLSASTCAFSATSAGELSRPAQVADEVASPTGPIPETFFSMVMHPQALTGMPWPSVGFGGIRLWDTNTTWALINTSRGVYDWTLLDPWLDLAQAHGVDVLYTFWSHSHLGLLKPRRQVALTLLADAIRLQICRIGTTSFEPLQLTLPGESNIGNFGMSLMK